jgi:hypothetical protein
MVSPGLTKMLTSLACSSGLHAFSSAAVSSGVLSRGADKVNRCAQEDRSTPASAGKQSSRAFMRGACPPSAPLSICHAAPVLGALS